MKNHRSLWSRAWSLVLFVLGCLIYVITYLPGKLLIWLAAVFSDVLRRRKGAMCTPIVTLEQPETGQRVTVIGTQHLARIDYFKTLRKFVGGRETAGAKVLYELVTPVGAEDLDEATKAKLADLKSFKEIASLMSGGLAKYGLIYQTEGLPIQETWCNTDMTIAQLAGRLIECDVNLPKFDDALRDRVQALPPVAFLFLFDMMARHISLAAFVTRIRPSANPMQSVILKERDEIAVAGVRRALTEGHREVVTIWGAGHVPGICRHLGEDGFKRVSREWVPAYRLVPRLTMFRMVLKAYLAEEKKRKNGGKSA